MLVQEKNIKGFNLLELIVVIVLVGILSASAYPKFQSWSKEREVRLAVTKIQSIIKNIHVQTERGTFGYVQVRFTNSGTEATMMAIMAARSFTKKTKIAKFEGGYHGTHDHVSVSVYPKKEDLNIDTHPGIPEYSYQPKSILDDVIVLPYNNIEKSKELISIHKEDLACVIMEPIISNFGYLPLDIEFIRFIRDITEELGILLIFDEIQSFRVASGGAQEAFDITPDMTTLGTVSYTHLTLPTNREV